MPRRPPPPRPRGLPKTGGRKKGTPNKATVEIKEFCRDLFERPLFRKNLLKKWDSLELDPGYMKMLTEYAYGRTPMALDLNVTFDPAKYLADKSPE